METYEVQKYRPENQTEWDHFVEKSKNGTFLFQRGFMDYHSHKFTDFSLLVYRNGTLAGVLPANLSDGEVHSHQGLSYGGLLLENRTFFHEV